VGPGGERNARYPGDTGHRQSIARHFFDRLVSMNGRHRHELDLGIAVGQDQRDRVIMPRVAIQNDFVRHPDRLAAGCTR
jgi:hypothetical protein